MRPEANGKSIMSTWYGFILMGVLPKYDCPACSPSVEAIGRFDRLKGGGEKKKNMAYL